MNKGFENIKEQIQSLKDQRGPKSLLQSNNGFHYVRQANE